MSQTPKNILIIKPSALGDVVLALPALSALRESYPDAKISWLIRPEFAPLIEGHPDLNEVIHFDRKLLGKAHKSRSAISNLIDLVKKLRSGQFDLVLDLQGLLRSGLMTFVTGAPKRVGMANAREGATLFYTDKVVQNMQEIHLVDFFLKMVENITSRHASPRFVFPADQEAKGSAFELMKERGVDVGRYAVLIPGSAQVDKCWPANRFALISKLLNEKFGLGIVSTGTNAERPVSDAICAAAGVGVANLAGQTSIRQLTAIMQSASIVISNDTGPGHIAAASGVPLVMMFGWSNPIRLAPYKRPECMLSAGPDTRGVKLHSYDPAHDIMNITVDQVFQRCCQQLEPSIPAT